MNWYKKAQYQAEPLTALPSRGPESVQKTVEAPEPLPLTPDFPPFTKKDKEYPTAGKSVSGLEVKEDTPNLSSIAASLDNYEILPGIREIPMDDFYITGKSYSVSENEQIKELAKKIKNSKTISPLIVVIDKNGPYILEGSHKIDALYSLGIKTFPALVVIDKEML